MKNVQFMLLFVGVNLFFIFFLVYKNSVMIQLSFQKQTYEKQKIALLKNKEHVRAQICLLQNRATIQEYAQRELSMQKIDRKQIKVLPMQSL